MAGGIDWFRWHHGSVNDQKFGLIARKAGASVAEVIAVWACLLEAASASADRGNVGEPDYEAIDCALGMDDGTAKRIYERMQERSIVDQNGRITSWEKRQPKREDDTATDRKRRQRERDKDVVTQESRGVTQSHDREEESREEESNSAPIGAGGKPPKLTDPKEIIFGYGLALLVNAGVAEKQARSFLGGLEKHHGSAAVVDKLRDCARAKPLQPLEWMAAALPPARASPKPNAQEALEASNDAVVQRVLAQEKANAVQ